MILSNILNTTWMLKCFPEYRAFKKATSRVGQCQRNILQSIIKSNKDTLFGQKHRFNSIKSISDFQNQVPPSSYEDYVDYINSIAEGQPDVLTRDKVLLFEPTSGTTSGEKLIPYTNSLRKQFQKGIASWIANLFYHRPAIRKGKAFWSISPIFDISRKTSAGIPIGFDDDAAYLGRWEQIFIKHLIATPTSLVKIPEIDTFRYCTLLHLLATRDLSLISVWSPTYLTELIHCLEKWHDSLAWDLKRGTISPPHELNEKQKNDLSKFTIQNSKAASILLNAFKSSSSLADGLKTIWPQLTLISCWADGSSKNYVQGVKELFPTVELQPKGLIATEGYITIPLIQSPAPALAIRSHFFEFQLTENDTVTKPDGDYYLAHELQIGKQYSVVLTTAGGLYRYCLNDKVEVAGFLGQCPLLKFLGKGDRVSDMVGEKLSEPFVRQQLEKLFNQYDLHPSFYLLAPDDSTSRRYCLYLQDASLENQPKLTSTLQTKLQSALEENPHYQYAISLGQLEKIKIELLNSSAETAWAIFEKSCLRRGQRVGNIKPPVLDVWPRWRDEFMKY